MATGNQVFDVAKATFGYYGTLPTAQFATCQLQIMLLKFNASFPADGTLQAATTFAAILALSNVAEATFTNYARISGALGNSVSIASHVVTFTGSNQTWSLAGGASNDVLQALILGFKPASGSADSAIIPLGFYGFAATTDGSNLTAQVNASGYMSAT